MKALIAIVLQQCLVAASALPVEVVPSKAPKRVETPYGIYEGFAYDAQSNNESSPPFSVDIYLSIPYAKAPIRELRFEKTQPLSPLPAELAPITVHNAHTFPPACPSYAPQAGEPMFSEDCLYLNIFAPSREQPLGNSTETDDDGLPVVVWIHGGAFGAGNTRMYGYESFAHNFVPSGIVVVTLQYRLGPFGFFSTGDKVMPGNLALWDVKTALEWIRENIRLFGGDPDRVTLWGHQAGSALVGALSVSKHSRGLFHQAIEMSGSMFAGWATSNSAVVTSRRLAKLLNCHEKGSKKVKTCLKEASTEAIAAASGKLGWQRDDVNHVRMQMRVDGDFLNKDIESLIREAPHKPTIQGITSQEAMLLTLPFPTNHENSSLIIPRSEWRSFDRERLVEFINKTVVPDRLFGQDEGIRDGVRGAVTWFYADRNASANATGYNFYLTRYTQLLSDIQYAIPSLMEVSAKRESGWPVHLYLLNYLSPKHINLPVLGTHQAYEFPHIFGFSLTGESEDDNDGKRLQEALLSSLTNFIRTGNPSSQLAIWPYVTDAHPFGFLDIRPEPVLRDNLMLDRYAFWMELLDKHHEFNLIRDFNNKAEMKAKSQLIS